MEDSGQSPQARQPSIGACLYRGVMVGTGVVAAILFTTMALLVCADVLLRNLGIMSIPWSVEVTEYMLMVSAFLAAPWLVYTNDHIRVDILLRGLSKATRHVADIVGNLICLIISLVLAVESVASMLDSARQGGMIFKVLVFPDWWLAIPMVICFILLSVEFVRRLACSFLGAKAAS